MTAPGSGEQITAELAEAIPAWVGLTHDEPVLLAAALLPVVEAYATRKAAEEIERLAEERAWTTQHDNEVVSARDLYEQVARLRGELDPVTYDFPPDVRADALAATPNHETDAT